MLGERCIELGGRAFDLLLALVDQPGRLAHKDTLMQRVWPKLVVDENNLAAQVASLRRALGAGAIRTVPGHGYRLELRVIPMEAEDCAGHSPAVMPGDASRLGSARRSWPTRLTPLIGRQDEVTAVRQMLAQELVITLVGGPGIGKSRLALEILALESSTRAAAWVPLQSLRQAAHVPPAVALALGISLPNGPDGYASLSRALQDDAVLLVLDGAEHLRDALAPALSHLVSQTRGLRVLLTSQTPLGIDGERVHRLEMLSVPSVDAAADEIARSLAVQLFRDRVSAADASFRLTPATYAQIAEICRRLDGNPLALELAAARAPSLGLTMLLDRMHNRLRLLKRVGHAEDPRHTTLHAALDWSHNLLSAAEKHVFETLAVFPGSFSMEVAAGCVADDCTDVADGIDLIARLVDRSLVTVLTGEPPRYSLPETARQYALAKLAESASLERAHQRFAAAMLIHMDSAYIEYWSLDEAIWLARYGPDLPNVRAALEWACENDAGLGVALYGSVWPLYVETDLETEGRVRFEQVVGRLSDRLPSTRVARFWEAVATYESGFHVDRARYAAELAAAFHARAGNGRARYHALMLLALNWQDDPGAARRTYREAASLEDPAWPVRLLALGAKTEGALAMRGGDFTDARAAFARAVRHALAASEHEALASTIYIVELDIASGDLASALQLARPLVQSLPHSGRRDTAFELMGLAFTALVLAGERGEARALGGEILRLAERMDRGKLRLVLDAMCCLACADQDFATAARLAVLADQARLAHGEACPRPAAARARECASRMLDQGLGADWRQDRRYGIARADVVTACKRAIGLDA